MHYHSSTHLKRLICGKKNSDKRILKSPVSNFPSQYHRLNASNAELWERKNQLAPQILANPGNSVIRRNFGANAAAVRFMQSVEFRKVLLKCGRYVQIKLLIAHCSLG